ncbi:retron Ec48 family effector membrane protein [Pseudomonas stutzeri]|uniref:retron Ec48 family effector membrane protein n=1 Tax=Stutzerimonas stutzeri TaxID=316 RepID=UPI0011AF0861|nr:retron Ec48 family effector membrane protein [Stutzerimonas stutzeri]MCQ4248917.1 retron Ec48 family effector membrane protein [Stutzerimonas stutzeri]
MMFNFKAPFLFVAFILTAGLSLATFSAVRTAMIRGYSFCFSEECIRFAVQVFEGSMSFAKYTLEIGASLATVIGVYFALQTYIDSVRARISAERKVHMIGVLEHVRSASEMSGVMLTTSQAKELYDLIFPRSIDGCFDPSRDYLLRINNLRQFIKTRSAGYGSAEGFSRDEHARSIYSLLKIFSIEFEEERPAHAYNHETMALKFLDNLNTNIGCADAQLSGIDRLYRSAFKS